jgi:hypothetical protein
MSGSYLSGIETAVVGGRPKYAKNIQTVLASAANPAAAAPTVAAFFLFARNQRVFCIEHARPVAIKTWLELGERLLLPRPAQGVSRSMNSPCKMSECRCYSRKSDNCYRQLVNRHPESLGAIISWLVVGDFTTNIGRI